MIAAKLHKLAVLMRMLNLEYLHDPEVCKPTIKLGKRERRNASIPVIRIYTDASYKTHNEYLLSSPKSEKWKNLLEEQARRLEIENHLEFRSELEHIETPYKAVVINKKTAYSKEVFDSLIEKNDPEIKKKHVFDGHRFRSKSEMLIAQLLKSMGLEYKYDVVVSFDNEVFYIDFAIYCHETGRFFFMEHFGDMGSERYRQRTFHKITVYTAHGLVEGSDILYTYENNDDDFDLNVYECKILSIVSAHAIFNST
ncbi:MAG: hypothetical protein IKH92_07900 [Clostridiales bacterium]|nr:hypothetical protein [Clostridiales bacterium]